jgi:metal-responsive CopG/Arc/MetJ family transcriptional regulator
MDQTPLREILVGIRDDQARELNRLAKQSGSSRAALIRDAIDRLLSGKRQRAGQDAFGLWGNPEQDGLTYQREIRAEW